MKTLKEIYSQSKRIKEQINENILNHYGYIDYSNKQTKNAYFKYVDYIAYQYSQNIINKYGYPVDLNRKFDKKDYSLK